MTRTLFRSAGSQKNRFVYFRFLLSLCNTTDMYQKAVICIFIVIPVFCLAVYLNGFFPVKTSIPGHAELRNFTLSGKILSTPPTLFDKLVIVLIDALRADFILNGQNNSMPHVSEMIRDGRGIVFDVKAHPPTVTLPRIKVE